jgi:hypothetical protein
MTGLLLTGESPRKKGLFYLASTLTLGACSFNLPEASGTLDILLLARKRQMY